MNSMIKDLRVFDNYKFSQVTGSSRASVLYDRCLSCAAHLADQELVSPYPNWVLWCWVPALLPCVVSSISALLPCPCGWVPRTQKLWSPLAQNPELPKVSAVSLRVDIVVALCTSHSARKSAFLVLHSRFIHPPPSPLPTQSDMCYDQWIRLLIVVIWWNVFRPDRTFSWPAFIIKSVTIARYLACVLLDQVVTCLCAVLVKTDPDNYESCTELFSTLCPLPWIHSSAYVVFFRCQRYL